jgi:hypothetical protein
MEGEETFCFTVDLVDRLGTKSTESRSVVSVVELDIAPDAMIIQQPPPSRLGYKNIRNASTH